MVMVVQYWLEQGTFVEVVDDDCAMYGTAESLVSWRVASSWRAACGC